MMEQKAMKADQRLIAVFACILSFLCTALSSAEEKQESTIVFVCEHGSVKSLIAANFFNRLAKEKGIHLRAVSRGITPDEKVPEKIAASLDRDGFDVHAYRPEAVNPAELQQAVRVVAIGVEIPVAQRVTKWSDVPPASKDYSASRDRIVRLIKDLISELQQNSR